MILFQELFNFLKRMDHREFTSVVGKIHSKKKNTVISSMNLTVEDTHRHLEFADEKIWTLLKR
jgi:hypothetical protein